MTPVFIFGLPRSGTSWLGKIFDSHPRTLLRHEPDTITPTREFPFVMPSSDIDDHLNAAREYLLARIHDRYLRCVANRPHFKKQYRRFASEAMRNALIYLLEGANFTTGGGIERRFKVPDLIPAGESFAPVIKSVDSVGRVPLFARSCPDCRFLYIIRHPCGVVNSSIRGSRLGKLGRGKAFNSWLALDNARARNLKPSDLQQWSEIEVLAWQWLLMNEFVVDTTRNLDNVKVVVYDQLCLTPETVTRELFDWTGLDWSTQTKDYLERCMATDVNKQAAYYSTVQNPRQASTKWESELPPEDISRISGICKSSPVGRIFLDNREGDLQAAH